MSNILKTNKLNSYPAIAHCMSPYPLLLSITSPPPHYPPIFNPPSVKLMSRKPTAVLAAGEVYIGGEADQQQGGRRQQEVSHRSWAARPRYLVTFCTAEVASPGIFTFCTPSMLQKKQLVDIYWTGGGGTSGGRSLSYYPAFSFPNVDITFR